MKLSVLSIPFVTGVLVTISCMHSSNAKSLAEPNALAAADAAAEPGFFGSIVKVIHRTITMIFKRSAKETAKEGVAQAAKLTGKDTAKQLSKSATAKVSAYAKTGEAIKDTSVEGLALVRDEILH